MKQKKIRKTIGYIIIGIYVLLITIIFFNVGSKKPQQHISLVQIPLPTSVPTRPITPLYEENFIKTKTSQITEKRQSSQSATLVKNLLKILPYYGNKFTLIYNYPTSEFIAIIKRWETEEGNVNFDNFLKEKGIESRSWIEKLVVRYEQNNTPQIDTLNKLNTNHQSTMSSTTTPEPSPAL